MKATAVSRIVRVRGIGIKVKEAPIGAIRVALPRRVMRRCPAIIFAVNRTHSVMGRMRFLDSSIRTIKDIRGMGVP